MVAKTKRALKRKSASVDPVCHIDRTTKAGTYLVKPDSWQRRWITEVELKGFDALPSGLFTDGRGLTAAGSKLLRFLTDKFANRLRLCITREGDSSIKRNSKTTRVTVNHGRLRVVNNAYRNLRADRNRELSELVERFLGATFPESFKASTEPFSGYVPGTLARVLDSPEVVDSLSTKDRKALEQLYPNFIRADQFSLRSASSLRFAREGLNAVRTVFLGKLVREFERKLSRSSTEGVWQRFLKEHILLLLGSYSAVIEKHSVAIEGKYPDFMVIDPYGYLDIYEIKKPQTRVLKYDASRSNYCWDVEICKAIAQVERYIDNTTHYRLELAELIRKSHQLQIKIVRPRGVIIAGTRAQLKDDDMKEDFRVLNDGLKHVDIIFYDDLLDNIKALLNRIQEQKVS